jgi:hypothetical protein
MYRSDSNVFVGVREITRSVSAFLPRVMPYWSMSSVCDHACPAMSLWGNNTFRRLQYSDG